MICHWDKLPNFNILTFHRVSCDIALTVLNPTCRWALSFDSIGESVPLAWYRYSAIIISLLFSIYKYLKESENYSLMPNSILLLKKFIISIPLIVGRFKSKSKTSGFNSKYF